MSESGIIVDDPEEQASYLAYQYEKFKHNNHFLELTICPTLTCNFRCSYCYESPRTGKMNEVTASAIALFVEECFEERPFETLRIVWYGGEPTLGIDVIENLSKAFMAFCQHEGITYFAHMITNGYLLDREVANRLIDCGLKSVQVSFGGMQKEHDLIRPARNGELTFETVLENAKYLASQGVSVNASYSIGELNAESCVELQSQLGKLPNFSFRSSPVDCYVETKEEFDKKAKEINPLTLEQYADSVYRLVMANNPDASTLKKYLEPIPAVCGSSLDRFFVIDELGNVYKCICGVSNPEERIFNVNDAAEDRAVLWDNLLPFTNRNPIRDRSECRECRILPLCKGMCQYFEKRPFMVWEHSEFLYNIERFVQAYYEACAGEGQN